MNGYNNGVDILNEIARQCYSSNDVLYKPGIVKNLSRTDVQNVSKSDYGEELIYVGNYTFPALWYNRDRHWTYEYSKKSGNGKGVSLGSDQSGTTWELENNSQKSKRLRRICH